MIDSDTRVIKVDRASAGMEPAVPMFEYVFVYRVGSYTCMLSSKYERREKRVALALDR